MFGCLDWIFVSLFNDVDLQAKDKYLQQSCRCLSNTGNINLALCPNKETRLCPIIAALLMVMSQLICGNDVFDE